ncbi:hypothetical protein [Paenibacillus arenilitoris]|uniref:Polymerase nucleotidyl transferase domain-containing protein n=1 Tax=Paenibacillus arenilitoris TaxID=2772299 RepID=A0A927CNP0_9BACL|nr:hypothetical protein [Paenibacillus arenilitoris]MBD2871349.1 hypothetical protein [Paenibacillus arenilitoris]
MKIGFARLIAAEWVAGNAGRFPGFLGAYFSGSTVGLPDDAELPASSDVDVVIVIEQAEPPVKLGKFAYRDTLIEATYLSMDQLRSAEEVLSSYHLAGSFRIDTVISDPTGRLRELQAEVARRFAEPEWVRRRCLNARQRIERGLRAVDPSAPLHERVTSWLFPTGVTTHVLLVAALRNPTVRLRYAAARDVLAAYGQDGLYPELLELLGCERMTPERALRHLDGLARTFDAAAAAARTPFFFSSDITASARPIAIDGSRALIRSGLHREAVFWIVATYARCHAILAADAPPDVRRELVPAFEAVVADLGVAASADLLRRADDVLAFLPRLWDAAEAIMAANPAITGR